MIPGTGGHSESLPQLFNAVGGDVGPGEIPSNKSVGGKSASAPAPEVKLDLWHAENRLIEQARRTHGAYRPFCANLRDALAIPDPEALGRVEKVLESRHPTWNSREIKAFMSKHYSRIVKHVPRVVPPAPVLVQRFDNVINTFRSIRDASTGTTQPYWT